MKQLERLLFEQGGDCFFCRNPLAKEDASVEHLLAQANGGTSAEENVVACCKALNALLGNKPLKEKFAIVLRQKGALQCPASKPLADSPKVSVPVKPAAAQLANGVAAKRPNASVAKTKVATPISSAGILALCPPSAPVAANRPAPPPTVVCPTCRRAVTSAVGQVDYFCPSCGAFRY
jgi:hypothetical protein